MLIKEDVVLVDENDVEIGVMEKMEAHEKGLLHRAFSVFIFNSKNEMLLQKRADGKYHSSGLWTNTCCSHPRKGESLQAAAHRRLGEEMGMECELEHVHQFIYKAALDKGLTEHELDHVFFGRTNVSPIINKEEAQDYGYFTLSEIENSIEKAPDNYTIWFKLLIPVVKKIVSELK